MISANTLKLFIFFFSGELFFMSYYTVVQYMLGKNMCHLSPLRHLHHFVVALGRTCPSIGSLTSIDRMIPSRYDDRTYDDHLHIRKMRIIECQRSKSLFVYTLHILKHMEGKKTPIELECFFPPPV